MQVLSLGNNRIGDTGMFSLTNALGNGALAQCTELILWDNQIGDVGMSALADALSKGALPQLETVELFGNQGNAELVRSMRLILVLG